MNKETRLLSLLEQHNNSNPTKPSSRLIRSGISIADMARNGCLGGSNKKQRYEIAKMYFKAAKTGAEPVIPFTTLGTDDWLFMLEAIYGDD